MSEQPPLVLVSNRGPVTYQEDGSVKRGTGGLVTALTGLASHRDAIWIASAMTDQDVEVAREHDGKPFEVEAPEGGSFRVRFVESDAEAYDRFYNIIANPMLWFIQHYLWDLSNAPDIRRHEVEAFEQRLPDRQPGPGRGRHRRDRGPGRARRDGPRLPLLHAARDGPRGAPGRLPAPLRPHPVDPAGRLARAPERDPRADLQRPAGERHHRLPHEVLPAQLPAVLPRPDGPRGRLRGRHRHVRRARGVGAVLSAADRLRGHARRRPPAAGARVRGARPRAAARVRDPARGPRRPVEERPARVHRLRHLPRAAPGVRRADHLHGAADAVADRRARVRRVPGEDRGARRRRQPPPRHARLDADRPEAARRPGRGRRLLQALRRDDGQRDVRRHEPRRQGRAARSTSATACRS